MNDFEKAVRNLDPTMEETRNEALNVIRERWPENADAVIEACDKAKELGFDVQEGFLEELKPYRK